MRRLRALGTQLERLAPIREGRCGAPAPLRVTALPGDTALLPAATMNCRTALALTRWMRASVVPAAARHFAATPLALRIGSDYQCRSRNRVRGAKLSEHAFANAIDIMSIDFGAHRSHEVGVYPADSAEARFQAEIRKASCRFFSTVIGPGSDAAHANHFHLDMRQRKNDYRVCD